MMAAFPGMKTGVLTGQAYEMENGKKVPLANHSIAIMVFQNGERVLMLDKTTDAKGAFKFQNIFRHADFVYSLGILHDENLFVIPEIQLQENEESKAIDFQVGKGSPYLVDTKHTASQATDIAMPSGSGGITPFSVKGWTHSHQKVALILSAFVLLLTGLIYFRKS